MFVFLFGFLFEGIEKWIPQICLALTERNKWRTFLSTNSWVRSYMARNMCGWFKMLIKMLSVSPALALWFFEFVICHSYSPLLFCCLTWCHWTWTKLDHAMPAEGRQKWKVVIPSFTTLFDHRIIEYSSPLLSKIKGFSTTDKEAGMAKVRWNQGWSSC